MGRPKSPLKAWIVAQRKAHGWKSEELARRLDVSESTVRGWEAASGGVPNDENLRELERVFGVTVPGGVVSTEQPDLTAVIAEQNGLLRQQIDAILRNAKATEDLVKALGARMDRLEEDRQRDFAALVEAIGQQLAPVIVGSDAGASNGSPDPAPVSGPDRK